MKRQGNLMREIAEPANLRLALWKASRAKGDRPEVVLYRARLGENLATLREELLAGRAKVGVYRFFKIYDPKERQICAAEFGERVLHHAVMNVCEPYFERRLIHDTYACRMGKGRLKAMERAQQFARQHPWYLKLDVRKYFDSVDQETLLRLLGRLFKDSALLELFGRVVGSYHTEPGKGVPIGNLTSQHFANLYLGELDLFVKGTLCVPGYVRYMDDSVLWSKSRGELKEHFKRVDGFLETGLKLALKPEALNRVEMGMPFLGARLFPTCVRLNRQGCRRFVAKLAHLEGEYAAGRLGSLELQKRATALAAYTETAGGRAFRQAVLRRNEFGAAAMENASGSNRVLRGGNWNNNANNCRVSNRNNNNPANRNNNNGFRCVHSSETSPERENDSDPAAVLSAGESTPPSAKPESPSGAGSTAKAGVEGSGRARTARSAIPTVRGQLNNFVFSLNQTKFQPQSFL